MTDRTLFDDLPAAAATADPETSHAAADRFTASGARGANCRRVLSLVDARPGATSVELWDAQLGAADPLDRHEVSRRLADLKNAGLVRQGPARQCRVRGRGKEMVTWWPVEGGT